MTDAAAFTEQLITSMNKQYRETAEMTAETVLTMIKAAGVVSLMPNDAIPLTGMLLMVNPGVYEGVRRKTKEMEND